MRQLAELLERSRAAREHVKSALAYPLVVLATGCASVAILFGSVIPRFGRCSMVPAPNCRPRRARSRRPDDIVREIGGLLLAGARRRFRGALRLANPVGTAALASSLLRMPGFGDLVTKIELARFGRTLGTLLRNGVSPLAALAITQGTI